MHKLQEAKLKTKNNVFNGLLGVLCLEEYSRTLTIMDYQVIMSKTSKHFWKNWLAEYLKT